MLSAPGYRSEELQDGGVILQLSSSPFDASKPEYADTKQRLYDYLGEDAFTGKTLPKFRIGEGRKKRDARPLRETGGLRDNIFNSNQIQDSKRLLCKYRYPKFTPR